MGKFNEMAHNKDYLAVFNKTSLQNIPLCDFHMHTSWTDGKHSVKEMHEQSLKLGLSTILFSEHARKSSGDWFLDFAREVRSLPQDGCRALVGVETRVVDYEGNLDSTEAILSIADLVVASVHRFSDRNNGITREFNQVSADEAIEMEFLLSSAILDNPLVDILGHPFGMCYRRFGITPPEEKMIALIKKAAQKGIAFEINSYYHPDPWKLITWCQKLGATLSLGSDAHGVEEIGRIIRVLKGCDNE